jgi:DMSO/TMAO reductase YedYZ molybdopterin-dependent catalytic subunit
MVESPTRYELSFAVLTGVVAVTGSYAVAGYTPRFVVAPIDDLIVRATPGGIVTFMIENVGEEAHLLHLGLAALFAVGLFGVLGLAGLRAARHFENRAVGSVLVGVSGWAVATLITGRVLPGAGAAVPAALVVLLGAQRRTAPVPSGSRRRVLGAIAGTVGFLGLSVGLQTSPSEPEPLDEAPGTDGFTDKLAEAEASGLSLDSDELPGMVSEIGNFYNVQISSFEPEIPREEWSLTFTGELTGEEQTVTFDDLMDQPVEHRLVTLRCVGERLNAKKLDTAVWTGTPIKPLLETVDPDGECGCAMLHGEDDYFVQFPTEVLENGFLAWGMNGKELPPQHGHPVRVLIPGHWGETNVKWLSEIELLDEEMDGYWEQRGWEGTGTVKTVAKLWDEGVTEREDGHLELAGHAYAGTRGISRVEVSTDGGDTWQDATLSEPLPDQDVWRQWRYVFEPEGSHEVVVRAVDSEGNLQIREESAPSPNGASGWVRRTVSG